MLNNIINVNVNVELIQLKSFRSLIMVKYVRSSKKKINVKRLQQLNVVVLLIKFNAN